MVPGSRDGSLATCLLCSRGELVPARWWWCRRRCTRMSALRAPAGHRFV